MAEFDKRADKHKRIIPAGFKETCESGVDIVGNGPPLAVIDVLADALASSGDEAGIFD